jgi:putative resolvase
VSERIGKASIHRLRMAGSVKGKLPVPARKMGKLILVGDLERPSRHERRRTVLDARVSSVDHRDDLDRQVARGLTWATEHGHSVDEVVTEVGSALNGRQRKFLSLKSTSKTSTSRP